jgi:predicted transglutaminase-like cysteine proteinase
MNAQHPFWILTRVWSMALALVGTPIFSTTSPRADVGIVPVCAPFLLPVSKIVPAPTQYQDFCDRFPEQCDMSGSSIAELNLVSWERLNQINRVVNQEIVFVADPDECGMEDYWTLPHSGYGDCEDIALEKRNRLAETGLPRAAMRMAIVQHQTRLFMHAVLTVDTSRGTFVLDNLNDSAICWNETLLNYELRENRDGTWSRFDQSEWPLLPLPQLQRKNHSLAPP